MIPPIALTPAPPTHPPTRMCRNFNLGARRQRRQSREVDPAQPFRVSQLLAGSVRPNSSLGSRMRRANRRPRGNLMTDEPSRVIWAAEDDPQDSDLGIEDMED